ncbi:MAG: C1 family peptidase [Myxococcota bacterium]
MTRLITLIVLLSALGLGFTAAAAAMEGPPGTIEYSKRHQKQLLKREKKFEKKALKKARKHLRKNPELQARYAGEGDPEEPQTVSFMTREGEPDSVVLDPRKMGLIDLGARLQEGQKPDNLAALYAHLWNLLPSRFRADLLDPDLLADASKRRVKRETNRLLDVVVREFDTIRLDISQTANLVLGSNPIGDCTLEVGYEAGDERPRRCDVAEYATDGIMRHIDFVLKDDLTCVKHQGNRGTCVAHGVSAALETEVMVDSGTPKNLSEQYAYFMGEITAGWSDRYVDGLSTSAVLDQFADQELLVPYEESWNYGRSVGRDDFDPADNSYGNSCLTYVGEMCEDVAFHAQETLTPILGTGLNLATYNFPVPPAGQGHGFGDYVTIPDWGNIAPWNNPTLDLDIALLTVEAEKPVLASIPVPPSFENPDANGYVQHVASETADGNHLILIVGFVANADLPAAAPLDPAGVGYFVIKNSWGKSYGDCGFSYVSYEFLSNWRNSLYYIDDVL